MSEKSATPEAPGFWAAMKSTIRGVDAPWQLAWGLCLGLAIGLIPKFSALPFLLAIVLVLSRANLLTGLIGMAMGILCLGGLQGSFDRWGWTCLNYQAAQPLLAWLQQQPLVPWLRINNTIVAGSLIALAISWLPLLVLAHAFFAWYHPHILARWRDFMAPETDPAR